MPRPLDGMQVVDLTHMLAGPFATHQLRLLGADVIKIEPPGVGDATRWGRDSSGLGLADNFVAINAGKRSVAADLKQAEGRQLVLDLCRGADVLVENFRPGVMAELGLDYDSVRAVNPSIVYCSISGFGQEGPLRNRPAYDHVVQAVTGMAVMNGDPDADPMKVGFPAVDTATGMSAGSAILAALLRRERCGEGQYIDVSMIDSAALLMYTMVTQYLATGVEPPRTGNRGFTGSPGCDTFATADGYVAAGANTPAQFRRLCGVLGVAELLQDPALFDERMRSGRDGGFATTLDPAALRARLAQAFLRAGAGEWERRLNEASVPAAEVRTVGRFAGEALAAQPGMVLTLPPMPGRPQGARTLKAGFRARFDPPGVELPAARLGEHTVEVLRGLGFTEERIRELIERRAVADCAQPPAGAQVDAGAGTRAATPAAARPGTARAPN